MGDYDRDKGGADQGGNDGFDKAAQDDQSGYDKGLLQDGSGKGDDQGTGGKPQ